MSHSKNRNSTGTGPRRQRPTGGISLSLARRMLPLVSRIAQDIQSSWRRLAELEAEQADLDRRKKTLAWPQRSRRYELAEEIAAVSRSLQEAVAELEQLDLILLDAEQGEVAFPTVVSNRQAYYLWRLGEPEVSTWCFANEPTRRRIRK
jgi:hypothetical protein